MALEYSITYQNPLIEVTVSGSPDYLSLKLAETVVVHRRAATARAFDDIAEAKRWLIEPDEAGA